jgi:hypothetical protein
MTLLKIERQKHRTKQRIGQVITGVCFQWRVGASLDRIAININRQFFVAKCSRSTSPPKSNRQIVTSKAINQNINNMNNQNEKEETHDFQKGYLTLPFNENQFAAFIRGLLGTPQTITKKINGNFEIHLKDLQNFHELLDQRITQQNNGRLIQLKTQVYYSDESSVLLGSFAELLSYNEVKPIVSDAVRMTWSYLIQFADKDAPEKQEIELMIISTSERNIIEYDGKPILFRSSGQFRLTIMHTARSWGSDIESLLTNQINSIVIPCSKFKSFINRRSSTIGVLTAILFLISSLISIYFITRSFNNTEIEKVTSFIKQAKDINSKTDYIINYIANNAQNLFFLKSLLYVVISIFVSIILGVWVSSMADNDPKSYIVLTREAKKVRDKSVAKSKKQFGWFWFSILISIVSSLIANYIFGWLCGL